MTKASDNYDNSRRFCEALERGLLTKPVCEAADDPDRLAPEPADELPYDVERIREALEREERMASAITAPIEPERPKPAAARSLFSPIVRFIRKALER